MEQATIVHSTIPILTARLLSLNQASSGYQQQSCGGRDAGRDGKHSQESTALQNYQHSYKFLVLMKEQINTNIMELTTVIRYVGWINCTLWILIKMDIQKQIGQ